MKNHHHAACSNSDETFATFKGCTVKGVIQSDGYILLFTCGWGLHVRHNGAFFTEDPDKVKSLIADLKARLELVG